VKQFLNMPANDGKKQKHDENEPAAVAPAAGGPEAEERVTKFEEKLSPSGSAEVYLSGTYAPVISARSTTSAEETYRSQGDEKKYMHALREKESEAYRMTWNTKIFSPKDVVAVVREALMGRAMVNQAATSASEKFDTPGPRWGEDLVKSMDPDRARYSARVDSRMWNGGGMTLAVSPMGRLPVMKIKAMTLVKLRGGEEREVPLCIELSHNAVAEIGLGMPAVQGNLIGSFYVKEWETGYRNAELARVLNELDPRIGVRVDGKKVETGSGYLL
jgi:hypothetical protein